MGKLLIVLLLLLVIYLVFFRGRPSRPPPPRDWGGNGRGTGPLAPGLGMDVERPARNAPEKDNNPAPEPVTSASEGGSGDGGGD
jgi:hypothetical protein